MNKWFNKNNIIFGAIIVVMAVLLFQGVHQIYHQDEYTWVGLVDHSDKIGWDVHPPVALSLLKVTGYLFGYGNLRVLPAFFAILNLILLYFVSKKLSANKSVALLAGFLFAFNVYSLIAGLQIDIDGAILPFFVLASYNAYLRISDNKRLWFPIFILSLIGGFLTKLSFILFVGALIVDYYLAHKHENHFQLKKIASLSGLALVLFGFVALAFNFFSPDKFSHVLTYAGGFKSFDFRSRAYLDLGFKILKSFVWLSPLLFLPVFYALAKPDLRHRYRFWLIYLLFNFTFYTVLFDFSKLTIERYFMFTIAPAAIIAAEVLYPFFTNLKNKKSYLSVATISIILTGIATLVLSFKYQILPLDPKIAYFHYLKSFNLRFLIPFTGGSGPIGFYFSAMFIFWFWALMFLAFVGYLFWRKKQNLLLTIIVVAGLIYNTLFIIEFLRGSFYGSVPNIARQTVDYVNTDPDIKLNQVITYYNIAPWDLKVSGKYASRFYTAPTRDYSATLTNSRGYYMIVDFPAISKDSLYWHLLQRCPIIKQFDDKDIHSYVFDCHRLPASKK